MNEPLSQNAVKATRIHEQTDEGTLAREKFVRAKTTKILSSVILLATIFPYVTLIPTPFDTQPYALAASAVLLVHAVLSLGPHLRIPRSSLVFFFVFAVAGGYFVSQTMDLGAARSLVGYASIAIISLAVYYGLLSVPPQVFAVSVVIWFVVALAQIGISREFGAMFLSRMSTSRDRGITALAVEPSYFAICCIFMLLLNGVYAMRGGYGVKTQRLVAALLFAQIFMAASALGFLLLGVYLAAYLIAQRRMLGRVRAVLLGVLLAIVTVAAFTFVPSLAEGRITTILDKFADGPLVLIYGDGSIADRLLDVMASPIGLFTSGGLGYGMDAWYTEGEHIIASSSPFVQSLAGVNPTGLSGRLLSGWGSAIFEIGIFGVLLVCTYIHVSLKAVRGASSPKEKQIVITIAITTFVLLIVAVPLAFPFFGLMVGVLFLAGDGLLAHSGKANGSPPPQ